jgi:glycerophosphoryl diester phosphodiesterase
MLRPILERVAERDLTAALLSRPLNLGHRGASGEAPENTLAAFELAARQGADGIELDVHLSADGAPVVIHDARLDRTTSGSGLVSSYTFTQLRRLDAGSWFNRRFPARARARYAGVKIPLLTEVLAWVRDRKCLAFVEIKQARRLLYPGIEEKVLEEIARAGAAPFTTVISFHLPTLRRLRQMNSRLPLGIDFTRPLLAIRRAKSLKATSVLPHWAFASRRFLRRAHLAGLRVLVWDLDRPEWMRRKILDGVDGAITRYPATFGEIRNRLSPTLGYNRADLPSAASP